MKIIAVLSHLMSSDCILSDESISRANLAIETFKQHKYSFLITIGWAYRADCLTPISNVFAEYILSNSDIESKRIISSPYSRDTVGDAYYLRRYLQAKNITEIAIVTSDYHVIRTEKIFKRIFPDAWALVVLGAQTSKTFDSATRRHEEESIKAFEHTFMDTDFDDIYSIHQSLVTKHPFYNGEKHPKIEFDCEWL